MASFARTQGGVRLWPIVLAHRGLPIDRLLTPRAAYQPPLGRRVGRAGPVSWPVGQRLANDATNRALCPLDIIDAERHALVVAEVEFRPSTDPGLRPRDEGFGGFLGSSGAKQKDAGYYHGGRDRHHDEAIGIAVQRGHLGQLRRQRRAGGETFR